MLECVNVGVGLARLETEFPEVTEFSEVTGRWCEKWSEDRNLMISGFLSVGVNCGLLQVENFVVSLHL